MPMSAHDSGGISWVPPRVSSLFHMDSLAITRSVPALAQAAAEFAQFAGYSLLEETRFEPLAPLARKLLILE